MQSGTVVAILPCNDLDLSERFYGRLGFTRIESSFSKEFPTYRMLSNGKGQLHLTTADAGWVVPGLLRHCDLLGVVRPSFRQNRHNDYPVWSLKYLLV